MSPPSCRQGWARAPSWRRNLSCVACTEAQRGSSRHDMLLLPRDKCVVDSHIVTTLGPIILSVSLAGECVFALWCVGVSLCVFPRCPFAPHALHSRDLCLGAPGRAGACHRGLGFSHNTTHMIMKKTFCRAYGICCRPRAFSIRFRDVMVIGSAFGFLRAPAREGSRTRNGRRQTHKNIMPYDISRFTFIW